MLSSFERHQEFTFENNQRRDVSLLRIRAFESSRRNISNPEGVTDILNIEEIGQKIKKTGFL
jgi:hypothetical protein